MNAQPTLAYHASDPANLWRATVSAFQKLTPRYQLKNPVMFCVYVGSILTTLIYIQQVIRPTTGEAPWFIITTSVWLWFTVLFANFAESIAEGRGKAQAESLKAARRDTQAKKLASANDRTRYTASLLPPICAWAITYWCRRVIPFPATGR